MAGVALVVVTLIACMLLLLLLHFERQSVPVVTTIHTLPIELLPSPLPPPPPPPPPRPYVKPLCQVTFGKAVCSRDSMPAPCPSSVDQVRHDTQPTASGAWLLSPTYTYFLDRGLVKELDNIFLGQSVIELGAGKGCYADALRRSPRLRPGATVRAFDGAPNVANITGGLVERADLTAPLTLPPAAWVLCLETSEHIPRSFEPQLLANMHNHNTEGIVLSWSNNAGGNGHVNLRTNEWVVRKFETMGYDQDLKSERALRRAVSDIHWFKDTLMVFRRRKTAAVELASMH